MLTTDLYLLTPMHSAAIFPETIKDHGIEEVFVLCTIEELNTLYKMPHYLEHLVETGLTVNHFPIEDGKVPEDMAEFLQLLTTMVKALRKARVLIQYVHLTSSLPCEDLERLYINNLIYK